MIQGLFPSFDPRWRSGLPLYTVCKVTVCKVCKHVVPVHMQMESECTHCAQVIYRVSTYDYKILLRVILSLLSAY